jgi:hypothetical protein
MCQPAEEQVLLVAEDDAPVGKVGVGGLVGDRQVRVAVEGQGDAVAAGELQEARQDVVVAVGGEDQVGIILADQMG